MSSAGRGAVTFYTSQDAPSGPSWSVYAEHPGLDPIWISTHPDEDSADREAERAAGRARGEVA